MAIKGFKAYEKGMKCKGFQYEEWKEYQTDKPFKLCESGFHFCENPLDILNYYDLIGSDFSEVEAIGEVTDKKEDDTKRATTHIKIGVKLYLPALIKASVDFLFQSCKIENKDNASSGYYSQHASSGDNSQHASSGDNSQHASSGYNSKHASSGDYSQHASSGDNSKHASSGYNSQHASSGDNSQHASSGNNSKHASSGNNSKHASSGNNSKHASSGYNSKHEANGENNVVAAIGAGSQIKGKIGTWITLAEYGKDGKCICVKSARIDGKRIKADIFYVLKNKKLVKA